MNRLAFFVAMNRTAEMYNCGRTHQIKQNQVTFDFSMRGANAQHLILDAQRHILEVLGIDAEITVQGAIMVCRLNLEEVTYFTKFGSITFPVIEDSGCGFWGGDYFLDATTNRPKPFLNSGDAIAIREDRVEEVLQVLKANGLIK